MAGKEPLYPHRPKTRPQAVARDPVDGYREILFTLYDSTAVVAGGKETPLKPELDLLRETVDNLVDMGALHPAYRNHIVPEYVKAAYDGDGRTMHRTGRMLFRDVVDRLREEARR